jgi:hypothetical protein
VGETGSPGPLILAAHVVPDVHGDNGRFVILVYDQSQAVRQHEFLVGNIDLGMCFYTQQKCGQGD